MLCSIANGCTGPIIWLGANSYIGGCASEANKGEYMGIFSGFILAACVLESIVAATVIPLFGQSTFYRVCLGLAVLACRMILTASEVTKYRTSSSDESKLDKAIKTVKLCLSRRMIPLIPYLFLMDIQLAFYNAFDFRIVLRTTSRVSTDKQNSITAIMYGIEAIMTILASLAIGSYLM